MSFALRTTFTEFVVEEYQRFDEEMHRVLSAIAGCAIPAKSLIQANLPPALGGLGVPSGVALGLAAFLASFLQSLPLQVKILGQNFSSLVPRNRLAPLLSSINGSFEPPTATLEMDAMSKHANPQEVISSVIHKQSHACLLAQANPRELARLNSVSGHHASDWLHSVCSAWSRCPPRSIPPASASPSGVPTSRRTTAARAVGNAWMFLEITRSRAAHRGIASVVTMLFGTSFTVP
jgi:hypothetical protein